MIARRSFPFAGLVLLSLAAPSRAQALPAPAPPAVPAAPAAPAPVPTIWNKLGITPANCQKCRERCCKSPLGQLFNNMTAPLGLVTGGLIQPLCPTTPTADQLAKLLSPESNASPGEKVAAMIKADEAGAAARRAALRYLGTVDCHYYPEAEGALIAGLRNDRNECVRLEAALALGKGCCCTKKTMEALAIAANGTDDGKNPAETSERVKAAAMAALMHCLAVGVKGRVEPPLPPERPPEQLRPPEAPAMAHKSGDSTFQLAGYWQPPVQKQTTGQLVLSAARMLAENAGIPQARRPLPTGQRNLMEAFAAASASQPVREEVPFEEAALASRVVPPQTTARLEFEEPHPTAEPPGQMVPGSAPPQIVMPRQALRSELPLPMLPPREAVTPANLPPTR